MAVRVSVVVPLYNKASTVGRAIGSVLGQTHPDLELIVVDDGSTDGGGDIVRSHRDPRIRLISQGNAGASQARNRGVAEATTELVAFLDADDEWHTDFLATVLGLRDRFPGAAVWATAYQTVGPGGGAGAIGLVEGGSHCSSGLLIDYFGFGRREPGPVRQPCNASSIMVLRSALLAIGGFMPGLVLLEDTDTLFRLALRYSIAYAPVPKCVCHTEAANRSDQWRYRGVLPFMAHAQAYARQCGVGHVLPSEVSAYAACYQTRGLYHNWYAGDRGAMLTTISECHEVRGFRMKCYAWWVLAWTPHVLAIAYWKLRAWKEGRDTTLTPVRSVYRGV